VRIFEAASIQQLSPQFSFLRSVSVALAAALISMTSALADIPATIHAITHATVINPANGSDELPEMTILVRGGLITAVGTVQSTVIPAGAVVHDVAGRFVIPGLWDAHVHLSQVGSKAFPLFVSNGITSVRDMGSDFHQIQNWRAERTGGAAIPRILAPDPKLRGGSFIEHIGVRFTKWKHEIRIVTSAADAREAVDELKVQGVDFIKVHSNLSPELYDAIASESHKVHFEFSGPCQRRVRWPRPWLGNIPSSMVAACCSARPKSGIAFARANRPPHSTVRPWTSKPGYSLHSSAPAAGLRPCSYRGAATP
jgi:hypothetical protein